MASWKNLIWWAPRADWLTHVYVHHCVKVPQRPLRGRPNAERGPLTWTNGWLCGCVDWHGAGEIASISCRCTGYKHAITTNYVSKTIWRHLSWPKQLRSFRTRNISPHSLGSVGQGPLDKRPQLSLLGFLAFDNNLPSQSRKPMINISLSPYKWKITHVGLWPLPQFPDLFCPGSPDLSNPTSTVGTLSALSSRVSKEENCGLFTSAYRRPRPVWTNNRPMDRNGPVFH